jgi:hypothetical protein
MLGFIISYKDKIDVEEEYEIIKSFDFLHKTDLNIFVIQNNKVLYKNDIINCASFYGHIQVLEWYKNSGYEFKYDIWAIYLASKNGHIQVLEWFKNFGYEFKYNNNAINNASRNGHIQVLEWFKNSGYEFKYDENAIYYASIYGHIKVLEWFKNSGYEFKYNNDAINMASYYGQVEVLKWFKNSNYAFKYGEYVFTTNIIKILKFYSINVNIKKLIKWSSNIFIKTIKFKTHNTYLKGYQKN